MRVAIHVKPGAKRADVGGTHDDALVVRVREPAVDGRATEAALRAVADVLAVPRGAITLVTGATSRRKILDVDGADPAVLAVLRAEPGQ
jgi:uncharacterized protein YggU (UPF0235/DUF167 family)